MRTGHRVEVLDQDALLWHEINASRPARAKLDDDLFPYASEIQTLKMLRQRLTLLNVQQSIDRRDSCILKIEARPKLYSEKASK